ncbi:hypothetical protein EBZ39_00300 [bacterium]|nr:hypothetical protein [bacterium]
MPRTKKTKEPTPVDINALARKLTGRPTMNAVAKKIKEQCKELYKHGWKKIEVTYSGSGDSCDNFEFTIFNEEESFNFSEADTIPREFMKELETNIWDLMPVGFENNEGGSGTIKINIKTGKISVEHDQYYIESHHTSETY